MQNTIPREQLKSFRIETTKHMRDFGATEEEIKKFLFDEFIIDAIKQDRTPAELAWELLQ